MLSILSLELNLVFPYTVFLLGNMTLWLSDFFRAFRGRPKF